MQIIDLGKLRFHFAGDWSDSATYEQNDIVKYGGNVYVYTYALASSGVLPTDTSRWALMIEGFKFEGVFDEDKDYRVGDGVAHGGKVYVCILDVTGITPPNSTYWSQFVDGIQYEGTYSATTAYQKNDVVVYGGSTYIARQDTVSHDPTQVTYWDKFIEGVSAQSIYNNSSAYVPNDLVAYGPNIYRAKVNTTGNVPTDTAYWEIFIRGTQYQGTYDSTKTYYLNDLVIYGSNLYRSEVTQSAVLPTVTSSWELVVFGQHYRDYYSESTEYYLNDMVQYGGNVYIATKTTTGNLPTDTSHWTIYSTGIRYRASYSASTEYYLNDVVLYGSNMYIATKTTKGFLPTDTGYWNLYSAGFSYQGQWSSATQYYIGQVISYGGSMYQAKSDNKNVNPVISATWDKLVPGFKNRGVWETSTEYAADDVVAYGGNTYISLTPHASSTFATDLTDGKWQKFNSGIDYRGEWKTATFYRVDDVVKDGISTYICLSDHTSDDFTTDVDDEKWEILARGAEDVLPSRPALGAGKSLTIANDGINYEWINATGSEHVFFVAPNGTDNENSGTSLATPYATVKYACQQAALLDNATLKCIYIKTGHYYEQLPIIVPPNTALFGDNQRTTTVHPKAGVDSDYRKITFTSLTGTFVINQTITGATSGATGKITHIENEAGRLWYLPLTGTFEETESISAAGGVIHATSVTNTAIKNENCMMFRMSNGTLAQFMNLKGMTGWVPGSTPDDITTSEPKGIGFTLNPESPITTASPYILDSAVFFSGGIGAYVDGRVHTSGNLSMLFHAYTNLNTDGVGYWARWGGKLEQVSCFTYYCYFGYTTSEGGNLRSLNGSNSWGTYGAFSRGYLPTETAATGSIYGTMLTVDVLEGSWNVGDTITGGTSGATGEILNLQYNVGKIYYKLTSGTFVKDELITCSSGGTTHTVNNSDAVTGQKGALFIMTGFSALPLPGASIQMAGDTDAYVIQAVSGTWTDTSSKLVITLVQETLDAYADGTAISIRYKYSQVRLTGHDFLDIGTGGIVSTNLPNAPLQAPAPGNEVTEAFPGRVYYVSTDQSGNFRVGEFFSIDQGTGRATLNASAFDLSGLTSLRLGSIGAKLGEQINEFSSDVLLSGDSNTACPTEHAVKTYVDATDATRKAYVDATDATRKAYVDAADALKAPLASPALTGTPTAPTAAANTNSTQIATTAFVKTHISANTAATLSASGQLDKAGNILRSDGKSIYWDKGHYVTGSDTMLCRTGLTGTFQYTVTTVFEVPVPATWSLISAPTGVTINSSTGVVTLSSSMSTGTYSVIVHAESTTLKTERTIGITISPEVPAFTGTSTFSSSPIAGTSYSSTGVQASLGSGATGSITYSQVSGTLPSGCTLNTSTGTLSGTAGAVASATDYTFTIKATNGLYSVTQLFTWTFTSKIPSGQTIYESQGSHTWYAPSYVTSVSAVAIGSGAGGFAYCGNNGGGGGGLGWKNNISVSPGSGYTVCVGCAVPCCCTPAYCGQSSWAFSCSTVLGGGAGQSIQHCTGPYHWDGGGWCGDGGGCGGRAAASHGGGGGAGGYCGHGGCGTHCCFGTHMEGGRAQCGSGGGGGGSYYTSGWGSGAGGGTGLYGWGSDGCGSACSPWGMICGAGGSGGSGGCPGAHGETQYGGSRATCGGKHGGGSAGCSHHAWWHWHYHSHHYCGSQGGTGGVRIIWGPGRSYPGTCTQDV